MRFFKLATVVLVLLFVAFFMLGIFIPKIQYSFTIDVQAPINKAYNAIASHELKPKLYQDIDPSSDKTQIKPFQIGSTSTLTYNKKGKAQTLKEQVISLDSLKYIELLSQTDESMYTSKIYFIDKQLITRLRIVEEMQGRSIVERSFLVVMQSFIEQNRKQFYVRTKQIIESTPDYNFRPEEQK